MTLRLIALYLALVFAPLVVASTAFAIRDRLVGRNKRSPRGNGHAHASELEHTVSEVEAMPG
jgi:hypothetical protein